MTAKVFEVWTEGYRATGDSADATYLGSFEADTFDDAVAAWVETYKPLDGLVAKRGDVWTYWGCQLFDNEADARKAFG